MKNVVRSWHLAVYSLSYNPCDKKLRSNGNEHTSMTCLIGRISCDCSLVSAKILHFFSTFEQRAILYWDVGSEASF